MRLRRAAGLALSVVIASCAPAPSAHSPTPSADTAAVEHGLSTAAQDMYDNRYTAADGTYARLLAFAPRSAEVHADFALFLAYRGELSTARTEASRALDLDAHSGHAAAILTRVDDWSGNVDAAAVDGRNAIRLAPAEALAHLFAAEAIADSGDLAGGAAQIAAARSIIAAHPTAYLRAELQREQSNLEGDRGDRQAQIASLRAAIAAQPRWLYRTTELVSAQFAAGDLAGARQSIDAVAGTSPDDVETLQTLGGEALFAGDAQAALSIWRRVKVLAPNNAAVLNLNGEVDIAAAQDVAAAVRDFQAAIVADPNNLQAAAYLMALARYVQHDEQAGAREIAAAWRQGLPPGTHAHVQPPPDPDSLLHQHAVRALAAVNAARAAAGLAAVSLDAALTASATSHAYYWLFNNLSPTVAGLGIHRETPGLTGYSGVWPWTRAPVFGYPNSRIGEDITHRGNPEGAVGDWVNSVYHRFAIVRPDLTVIGFADAELGPILMEDMEFGFAPPAAAAPVLYPADGQRDVPATFVDNELPDPVPAGQPRTTGYPVTVTFSYASSATLRSFTLAGPSGDPLPAYVLGPSSETENSASLLPAAPLHPRTRYTAHIVAGYGGRVIDTTWSFSTA